MNTDFLQSMTKTGNFSLERLEELNEITTRAFTRLADIQLNCARVGIEGSMEQARLFTSTNDYGNLLSAETELASRYGDQVMDLARETTELVESTRGDLMQWFEKRMGEAEGVFEDAVKEPLAAMPGISKPAPAPRPAAKKKNTASRSGTTGKSKSGQGKATKTTAA